MGTMDFELIKYIGSIAGTGGLILYGLWRFLNRLIEAFTTQQETINSLYKDRADAWEKKLDDCEKKHETIHQQMGQVREDNGELRGRVKTLEHFVSITNPDRSSKS